MTELNTFLIMAQAIVVVPVWWLTLTVICASHALLLASKCLHMLLASSCNQCLGSQVLFLSTNVGPHIFCGILHIVWPLYVRDGPGVPRMVWWLISLSLSLSGLARCRLTETPSTADSYDIRRKWLISETPWLQTNAKGEMQSAKKVKKAIKTCQTKSAYLKIQATIQLFSRVFQKYSYTNRRPWNCLEGLGLDLERQMFLRKSSTHWSEVQAVLVSFLFGIASCNGLPSRLKRGHTWQIKLTSEDHLEATVSIVMLCAC